MRNEAVLTEELGNYRIGVYYDECEQNPRVDWDNASHMVVRSRHLSTENNEVEEIINALCEKYGIDNDGMDFFEVIDALNEFIVIKPISIYVHSGMTVFFGLPTDRWDSGVVGFGYMEHEDLYSDCCGRSKKAYPDWRDQCEAIMNGEMEVLDRAVQGNIYGYVIEELDEYDEWAEYDSCWGFFEDADDVMEEAKACLPKEVIPEAV